MDHNLPALEGGIPVRKEFLVFGSPLIGQEEISEVVDSLRSGWLGTGPKVSRFEKLVKDYTGAKYAVALNSCTAGLHLSLLACGVGREDEVILPTMTFGATANVVEHVGAKPIFVDCELETMNIDTNQIQRKISKKTKAIIPVHMAGRPCNMDEILRISKKYNLKIIEDAAHAFGASYKGRMIGTIGDLTSFSFYVTKNLVTGEGGMVTTNNRKYSDFIQLYALHGMSKGAWSRYSDRGFKHYLIQAPGYKYNMMDIQAALGIHQLARFTKSQQKRKVIWDKYNREFKNLPLIRPSDPGPNITHAYHLYTILVDTDKLKATRDQIQNALHAENIGIGIHFIALHLHPYYANKYHLKKGDFPNSEFISDRTISLPLSAKLSDRDVEDVIKAVRKVLLYYMNHSPRTGNAKLPKAI